jgi:hypothetical protein
MGILNEVLIIISSEKTGENYLSRSYPDDDYDNNGKIELYKTPVFKVYIKSKGKKIAWKALRFMPYWNDPKQPSPKYKLRGWTNSGLGNSIPKKQVTYYNPAYGTHNRYSPYSGAIQIQGSFLIHAGPNSLIDYGWGAAGCVEIIGNFDQFKNDIRDLSGSNFKDAHKAIQELVKAKKLFVKVEAAIAPNLRKNFWVETSR